MEPQDCAWSTPGVPAHPRLLHCQRRLHDRRKSGRCDHPAIPADQQGHEMSNPLNTIEVLRAEAKEIHGADLSHIPDDKLALALNDLGSTALCLSGGGIRSAVFALGIIQALAQRPRKCKDNSQPPADKALLGQFNYLSTVSGGGYIGGWLSAWLSRQPYADVVKLLNAREGGVN